MRSGLTEFEAILAVARHRNFRAAAADLEMSTSALSQAVAALESRIGARLFNRTTRSVSLSEAGERFVAQIAPALETIGNAIDQAGNHQNELSGTLRINTSVGAARQIMTPLLIAFLQRHPQMKVDLVTEGRMVDIVADGFDAGVRLGENVPQDMISVPLRMPQRFAVVGSPSYFANRPVPRSPADLDDHVCIRSRLPSGGIYQWEFERGGHAMRVDVRGALTLDEPTLMLEAARAGIGLAYLTEWHVAADVISGALLRVLKPWTPAFEGLCLYYPGRRHVPAGLRALIELVREKRSN